MTTIRQLIVLFLELNPKPADAQVHSLAAALGMDKETLESIIYQMLGEVVDESDLLIDEPVHADVTEVLDGEYNEDSTPDDDLIVNDGEMENTDIKEEQDLLRDDGETAPSDNTILNDDGLVMDPSVEQQLLNSF